MFEFEDYSQAYVSRGVFDLKFAIVQFREMLAELQIGGTGVVWFTSALDVRAATMKRTF
jgi:hypothetical protein